MVTQDKHPIVRAMEHFNAGNLSTAMATLGCFFQDEPDNPDAHQLFGLIMARAGQKEPALLHLMRSVELSPERMDYAMNAGQLALSLNKLGMAEKAFRAAAQANPKNMEGWLWLSRTYEAQNRLDDAVALLSEGIASLPDNATLPNALGGLLLRQGHLQYFEH